jgi:hypothetical protein
MKLFPRLPEKGHFRTFSCPVIRSSGKSSGEKTSETSISSSKLKSLKKRNLAQSSFLPIAAETVAKVVKSYVLPMIKYKCSDKFENTSLVNYLGLIEKLQMENEKLTQTIEELRENDKIISQERYEYLEEINRISELNIDQQTQMHFLNTTMTQTLKHNRRIEKQLEYSRFHKSRAEITVEEYDKKIKMLFEELQTQRDLNNIRFFFSFFFNQNIVFKSITMKLSIFIILLLRKT